MSTFWRKYFQEINAQDVLIGRKKTSAMEQRRIKYMDFFRKVEELVERSARSLRHCILSRKIKDGGTVN